MSISTERLSQVAGVCLVAAGALFIGVQINHPPLTLDFVGTNEFVVRQTLKMIMTVLALVGITGLYASHARALGVLGLVGYVLFGAGYLTMFSVEVIAGFVLPAIAQTSPAYVQDVLTAAQGGAPAADIGNIQILLSLSGIGYLVGGLLFGIALFRARVVARWAAALLAVATVSTVALAVLPESFNRPFAIPTGIALIGLGWSSWRTRAATVAEDVTESVHVATRSSR